MGAKTAKVELSMNKLSSLTRLFLSISGTIDEDVVTRLLEQVQHIQELFLDGNLSYFNLDHLVNLKRLSLSGSINENFNFEIFKNLSGQLEDITIGLSNIDGDFVKLVDSYSFPYLVEFSAKLFKIRRLKKKFLDRFPKLRHLTIAYSNIEVIEHDSFSNLEQLSLLDLSRNRIGFIEKNAFSSLKNLLAVDLSRNRLTIFDPKFIGLIESAVFSIECQN